MDTPSRLGAMTRTGAILIVCLFSAYGGLFAMSNALPDGPTEHQRAALDRGEAVPIQRADGATVWAIKQDGEVRYFHSPYSGQSES